MEATKIAILGSGALAQSLALALEDTPCELSRWARDPSRLAAASSVSLAEVGAADVAMLAVTDSAIGDLAQQLVSEHCLPAVVLHTSGFHGLDPLRPLADAGCDVGGWHPLVSVPAAAIEMAARRFDGCTVSVFGTGQALAAARGIAERLGATPLEVLEPHRSLYHATAALAANGLVALMDLAVLGGTQTLAPGSNPRQLESGLTHLAQGVLANVAALGSQASLTGPVPRGDVDVLAGHLATLEPQARAAYRALLVPLVELARKKGTSEPSLAAIESLLQD